MRQSIPKKLLVSSLIFSTILVSFGPSVFEPKIAKAQLSDSGTFSGNGNILPGNTSGVGATAGANIKLGQIATSIVDCGATAVKNLIFDKVAAKAADSALEKAIEDALIARKALEDAKISDKLLKGAKDLVTSTSSLSTKETKESAKSIVKSSRKDLSDLFDKASAATADIGIQIGKIKAVYDNSDQLAEAQTAFKNASSDTATISGYLATAKTTEATINGIGSALNLLDNTVPTNDEATRSALSEHLSDLGTRIKEVGTEVIKVRNETKDNKKQSAKLALKQSCLKGVANAVAKTLLRQFTIKTVEWINSGFDGKPFYPDVEQFVKDIGKNEIAGFVSSFDKDSARFPFGKAAAIEIINRFNHNYFERNAEFTLNNVIRDDVVKNFYGNFSVGGWSQWISVTQFPQNNPIGFRMMAADELSARTAGAFDSVANIVRDEIAAAQGFLSFKQCVVSRSTNGVYIKPSAGMTEADYWDDANLQKSILNDTSGKYSVAEKQIAQKQMDNDLAHICAENGVQTQTPGTFLANQLNQVATNSPIHQMELADDINRSLAAIFDALLNQGVQYGIRSLKGASDNDSWVQGIASEPDATNLVLLENNPGGEDPAKFRTFSFSWKDAGDPNATARLEISQDSDFLNVQQMYSVTTPSSAPAIVVASIDQYTSYFVRARACPSTGCLLTGASNVIAVNHDNAFNFPALTLPPKVYSFNNPAQPDPHYFTFTFDVENGGLETQTGIEINNNNVVPPGSNDVWIHSPLFPVITQAGPQIPSSNGNTKQTITITIPIVDTGSSTGYKNDGVTDYFARASAINGRGPDYGPVIKAFKAVDPDLPIVSSFNLNNATITAKHADFTASINDGGLSTTAILYIDQIKSNLPSQGGTGATSYDIKTLFGGNTNMTFNAEGLKSGTTYFAEIKATNTEGDAYSTQQIQFTTK